MPRIERNAAGEDVRVDTEEFGCVTIEAPAASTKTKSKAACSEPGTDGEE